LRSIEKARGASQIICNSPPCDVGFIEHFDKSKFCNLYNAAKNSQYWDPDFEVECSPLSKNQPQLMEHDHKAPDR
jgi:hypothetical protein